MAVSYWDFLQVDTGGDEVLSRLQGAIRGALEQGQDPAPSITFALIDTVVALQNARAETAELKAYVLTLEARIYEAGLRLPES